MNTKDPMDLLADARPTNMGSWPASPRGEAVRAAVLQRVADGDKPADTTDPWIDRWRRSRRLRVVGVAAAVVVVAVAGALAVTQLVGGDSAVNQATGQTQPLSPSYGFDVTHLPTLLEHADGAFVGDVEALLSDNEDDQTRSYRVRVVERIIGDLPVDMTVRQNGYVDDNGITHQLPDQTMLQEKQRYLLVIGDVDSEPIVMAGPLATQPVPNAERQAELVARYRDAASRPSQ
ncbi:hypothetical protein [Haloechinothrix halophila]|uniref:hypothetical protein n=1 Tax=Haloechinothrix halophila TaxID=1069073 RepID=UPI000551B6A9|nr:hypothetical protein [Haloechinothrix halophila]